MTTVMQNARQTLARSVEFYEPDPISKLPSSTAHQPWMLGSFMTEACSRNERPGELRKPKSLGHVVMSYYRRYRGADHRELEEIRNGIKGLSWTDSKIPTNRGARRPL